MEVDGMEVTIRITPIIHIIPIMVIMDTGIMDILRAAGVIITTIILPKILLDDHIPTQ